jgi:RNA polymerase sigma-70 factor (ECF subfamily)
LETTLTQPVIAGGLTRTERRHAGLREEEFDSLVRAQQRRIFRLLMTLVRDEDAADTLTQECFLRAYRRRASFRGESTVETWLARIAVNLATDHVRSRRVAFWKRLFSTARRDASAPLPDPPAPQASPERAAIARQEASRVWAAAERLPAQQKTAFLLRFAEEMTLEEIAGAMGLNDGTIKAHLHRAVTAVRAALRDSEKQP